MKTQHCLPILIIAGLWSYPREGFTEEFDTTLLAGESAKGDISRLYQENTLPSGEVLLSFARLFVVSVSSYINKL